MTLSIIIPAYNEEKRIATTIKRISNYLNNKKIKHELIIIDDCSTDRTVNIVEETSRKIKKKIRILRNKNNYGKGFSVRVGVLAAKNDLVLFSDADMSTPIEELDSFLKCIGDYDIVIASRNLPASRITVKQPFYRQLPGKIFPLLVNMLLIKDIKDTQCGFKLFRKEPAKRLFKSLRTHGWAFDVEVLYKAKKLGYRIKELPVTWINDPNSKIRLSDPFKMFWELVKIRVNN